MPNRAADCRLSLLRNLPVAGNSTSAILFASLQSFIEYSKSLARRKKRCTSISIIAFVCHNHKPSKKAPAAAEALIFPAYVEPRLSLGCLGLRSIGFGGVGLRVFAAEALHAAGGVDHLLLAREERVAVGADFHVNVALMGRAGLESVTAGALHTDGLVIRVNSWLGHWSKTFLG